MTIIAIMLACILFVMLFGKDKFFCLAIIAGGLLLLAIVLGVAAIILYFAYEIIVNKSAPFSISQETKELFWLCILVVGGIFAICLFVRVNFMRMRENGKPHRSLYIVIIYGVIGGFVYCYYDFLNTLIGNNIIGLVFGNIAWVAYIFGVPFLAVIVEAYIDKRNNKN
ncbi:MAG: hypothetical protein KUA35_05495 [Pseudodesulfovibrio sp.]|uniref:Uncharacterized protein n=1 Tax=Pseudodesulfovibrio aespoeensis (strain ATCC 700646 / DSM 10631 / Aspo-2) TaxID=643562 RepID=E6VQX1_PSEA9|nr:MULTISPECIES: hypothetical protein [Pseudodesulfovibrio]MBU4244503.1 hypothetical protein [Pseudomonadota bacterium]ADU62951.1 hypothetical protein Daes_1942 [Pseudodesulfovibrio aespoeensis Aspo-2]MBU4378392.1 hypothetical protein [Pseudomonadota bacterium]MBU4474880.1 hypothetical protein [Pseudomonadota bacterium]MBU4522738.1 hypothetical protein [Pseudomonadota bacterium]